MAVEQMENAARSGNESSAIGEQEKTKVSYAFETFETLADIPAEEALAILTEQAEFMHRRVMEAGASANDPQSHVSAFWKNIEAVLPPNGRFYLVRDPEGRVIGCGAIRKIDEATAEMKHLFIHGDHRGHGLGRQLVLRRLDDARKMGVTLIVADTIGGYPEMPTLYDSLGFERVDPSETSGTMKVAPQIAEQLIFFRKVL
jgi:GNAT superfamily N-acetyltransferase